MPLPVRPVGGPDRLVFLFRGILLVCGLGLAACAQPDPSGGRAALLHETKPGAAIPHLPGLNLDGAQKLGRGAAPPERAVVRFDSDDSDLFPDAPTILEAALYRPVGRGPFPVVVALHDCMGLYGPSGAMNSHMRDWAERLVAQGYAVLMPDSFNPRGVPEMCDRDPEIVRAGVERARDVSGALDWLGRQSWAASDRVALVGWANGGTTALGFAASPSGQGAQSDQGDRHAGPASGHPRLRAIVAFYPSCAALNQAPGWRSDIPLTVFSGARDDWAPAKACVGLADRIGAGGGVLDLVKYSTASHEFDAPGMPLHTKAGVTTTKSGGATIGTDTMARTDSIERLTRLLAAALHPAPVP
jgi:dienelactone hydrolase